MKASESLQNHQSTATEKALRRAVDTTPAFIHTGRPDGYLDYFNRGWLDFLGKSLEDVCGWRWTESIHPEDVAGIVQKWHSALASGEPFEAEARVRRADGTYRALLHRKVPLRDEHGNIVKWFGSSLDIEDRRRAEEQFRRSTQELQRSEFYLAEGQRLAQMGSWAFDAAGFDYWSPELFRIYGLDPTSTPPTVQEYLNCIHLEDREFMANLIKRILAEPSQFDVTKRIVRPDGEVRYIRCVGAPIVENQKLKRYIGSALDVTEHELLTQELQRREAYLAEAQRLSHTGSFGWKPDTGEIIWSDETYRIFEYDGAVTATIDLVVQRVHPEDRADVQSVIARASEGAPDFEHAYRLLMPDGRTKHVHALAHATWDASGNREFVGAVTDITDQRLAEESLRESESYLAETQKLSHTGSWAWSPEKDIRYWSEECYRVLGFDPHSGLPRVDELIQRVHPDDRVELQEVQQRAIREKLDVETEYRIVHPSGAVRDIHSTGHPVLSASGDLIELIGTVIDVTEQRQARAELEKALAEIKKSEDRLRVIIDTIPTMAWVDRPDGSAEFLSRGWLDYTGLSMEEALNWGWAVVLHSEDSTSLMDKWLASVATGKPFEAEARFRRADGKYRWCLCRGVPLRDEAGNIIQWHGTTTDIEDRKRAEEDIKALRDELQRENIVLREELGKTSMFEEVIGTSSVLQSVLARAAKVAPTDSTVLIMGETGTGKELIARAIHKRSKRSERPFISVNCGAIPPSLIMSELFGHEKGAFTGALQRRLGKFELAEGGTIFLDEVGDLPPETQVALLRVLQEREFERVGGTEVLRADVRVISATNCDLQAAIADGAFRNDLYYRLNVFPIKLPPLRERKDDVPSLVNYFVDRYAKRAGKKIEQIEKKSLEALQEYSWPGNVRELQNVIERSLIIAETNVFSIDKSWLAHEPQPSPSLPTDQKVNERKRIEAALAQSNGKVSGTNGAAAKLGIPASTLESKIRALRINKLQFKGV